MAKDEEGPKIPSWEELGISPEELAELEKELDEAGTPDGDDEDALAGLDIPPAPPVEKPAPASTTATAAGAAAASAASAAADKGAQPAAKKGLGLFGRLGRKGKGDKTKPTDKGSGGGGGDAEGSQSPPKAASPPPKAAAAPPKAASPQPPPAPPYRGLVTLVLLVAVTFMARWDRASPRPLPVTAPDTVFSAERAVAHLTEVARAAHPPGSPEHTRVRGYLVDQLASLGLTPQVQTTTEVITRGRQATAATVRNVVARIPGTASTGALLITAHYDGREIALAAGDDGAGVATILEAVRALTSGPPVQNDIIVLITDAEEVGLLGARAFASQHPWMDQVRFVISIEMRGGGGPSIMFETGRENGWTVQEYARASPAPTSNSLSYEIYKRLPNDTDFSPFRDAGLQGLNFAAIGRAHVYHQQYDNVDNLSARTVQHHGVQALALLRHFGSLDLSGSIAAPDRVHFSVPFLGAVTYAPWVSTAFSGILLLLATIMVVVGRKSGARMSGLAAGFGVALLLTAIGVGLGFALARWLPRFHVEAGALHGSLFHSEGWYVTSLAVAVLGAGFAILAVARRWFAIGELAVGAALAPALAGIAAGPFLPMAAMNIQWPALVALLGAAVVAGVGRSERVGLFGWLLLLVLMVPALVFMAPLFEVLWLAMNISIAPVLGGVVALTLLCVLALTDVAREPSGWTATGGALLLAAVLLGVGLGMSRPSETRPEPSTLFFTLDRETGASAWMMDPAAMGDGDTPLRPGLAWSVEQGGTPDALVSLEPFVGVDYQVARASAPSVNAAALAVALATPENAEAPLVLAPGGTTTVRVRSTLGAEALVFLLPESGTRVVAINGRPLSNGSDARSVRHWGEPDGAVELEIRLPSSGPAQFSVIEHLFRPAELVGAAAFARPPGLAPNINRMSDRALIRTAVSIDLATAEVTFVGGGTPAAAPPPRSIPGGEPTPPLVPSQPATELSAPVATLGGLGRAGDGAPATVQLFARDRVSSVDPEFAIAFAPDGRTAYFNRTNADRSSFRLLTSILSGGVWSAPEPVPFAGSGRDIDPFVTPDGDRIYFASDRPRAGAPAGSFSIWYVDRTPNGWSRPVDPGAPFNSDSSDVFVSAALDGTTMFSSTRGGARRIYQTRPTAAGWAEPSVVRFGSVEAGGDPLISPDGSYILFVMDGPIGGSDLFVSCRVAAGTWSAPALLPEPINSPYADFAPALHPDGSLLFTSERPGILGPVPEGVRPAGDVYRTEAPVTMPCS